MRILSVFLLSAVVAAPVFSQSWTVGAKGGWSALDTLIERRANVDDLSNPYLVGPFFEVGASWIRLEVDALYRPVKYRTFAPARAEQGSSSWEFPVMAKLRAPFPVVKPFLVVGPTFRTIPDRFETEGSAHVGVTGGVGVDLKLGWLVITPEARYVRWSGRTNIVSGLQNLLEFRRDQVQVLLGVGFGR